MMSKKGKIDVKSSLSSSFVRKTFSGSFSSKGQITIFIILGILLLLIVALILLLQQEIISFDIEELIPTEAGKVENYITDCIESVGEDALDLAGLQGGFIEVPERYSSDW